MSRRHVAHLRTRGWYPWGGGVSDWIASAEPTGDGYELWAPGVRVRVRGEGDIVDVHRHAGEWLVAWNDRLACYVPDGGERWGVPIGALMRGRQVMSIGDGCVWLLHEQELVGIALASGATVASASFSSHRIVAGVLEIEGGIVVEFDREVWWCDRSGKRVLAEALSLGRKLASNGRYAISVDADGWFVRLFAPDGHLSMWQLTEQTRGLVLGEDMLRLGAHDPIHVPLAAFDGDEARLRRLSEPASLHRTATSVAQVLARAGVLATSDEVVLAEAVHGILDAADPHAFDLWSLCFGVAALAGHAAAVRILDASDARRLDEELRDSHASERIYIVPPPRGRDDARALCLLLPYRTAGLLERLGFALSTACPYPTPSPRTEELTRDATIAAYRGHDEGGSSLAIAVEHAHGPTSIGMFRGFGNTLVSIMFADVARSAFELACTPGEPTPLPALERSGGDPAQVPALTAAFTDRSPLPADLRARALELAARVTDVTQRCCDHWYGPHGARFAADGVIACTDGARLALVMRGATRIYRVDADGTVSLLLREHTFATIFGPEAGVLAHDACSSFSAGDDRWQLPESLVVADLAPGARVVAVIGRALERDDARIEALVRATSFDQVTYLIDDGDPYVDAGRWGVVAIASRT